MSGSRRRVRFAPTPREQQLAAMVRALRSAFLLMFLWPLLLTARLLLLGEHVAAWGAGVWLGLLQVGGGEPQEGVQGVRTAIQRVGQENEAGKCQEGDPPPLCAPQLLPAPQLPPANSCCCLVQAEQAARAR